MSAAVEVRNGNGAEQALIDAVFQRGILIDLKLSGWTATTEVRPEDIGLESVPDKLMSLGRKKLISKEYLGPIVNVQNTARRVLNQHTQAFLMIRDVRFCPETELDGLLTMLEEYKVQHDAAVEKLVENYEVAKAKARVEWEEALRTHFSDHMTEEQIQEMLVRLDNSYPSVDRVRGSFEFDWSLFQVSVPPGISARVTSVRRQAAISEQAEKFVNGAVRDLRTRITELVARIREAISGKDNLQTRTVESVKKEIDRIRALNWMGDSESDRLLTEIQKEVEHPFKSKTSLQEMTKTVTDEAAANIEKAVAASIRDLVTGKARKMKA